MSLRLLPSAQPEKCCVDQCRYRPDSIRRVLQFVRRHGVDQLESIMNPQPGYDTDGVGSFGPEFGPTWRLYAADLDRAVKAGHRTPEAIGRYLCSYALEGQDELLEAA